MEREVWADKKMQDFCINSVSELVQLDDGILPIDKENIETSFCFGAGMYGHSTEDEDKEAARMALRAERDKDYFIRRNMESWKRKLDALMDKKNEVFVFAHYYDGPNGLKGYCTMPQWKADAGDLPFNSRKATAAEKAAIIAGVKNAMDSHLKRIEAYLKRYGLSKVRTWTYIRD